LLLPETLAELDQLIVYLPFLAPRYPLWHTCKLLSKLTHFLDPHSLDQHDIHGAHEHQ